MAELPRRVVILMHERDRVLPRQRYQILGIGRVWRSWGIEVIRHCGVHAVPDADVIVNHVDLSRTPPDYAAVLARYPVAINGRCLDITKRAISRHLLAPGDGYDGPVIVKTDLNSGGAPERARLMNPLERLVDRVRERLLDEPWRDGRKPPGGAYRVFERAAEVPAAAWTNPHLVVERFLPERRGALYVLRTTTFFGGRAQTRLSLSVSPVVKSFNAARGDDEAPDPAVLALAARLGIDRGKIDHLVHDGESIVLDVNRTNVMGRTMSKARAHATYERLAHGLRSFWPPRVLP